MTVVRHTRGGNATRMKRFATNRDWRPKNKRKQQQHRTRCPRREKEHISPNLRRDRMRSGAHVASATLACTPGAERTTPKAMQQFHLQKGACSGGGPYHRLGKKKPVRWFEYVGKRTWVCARSGTPAAVQRHFTYRNPSRILRSFAGYTLYNYMVVVHMMQGGQGRPGTKRSSRKSKTAQKRRDGITRQGAMLHKTNACMHSVEPLDSPFCISSKARTRKYAPENNLRNAGPRVGNNCWCVRSSQRTLIKQS